MQRKIFDVLASVGGLVMVVVLVVVEVSVVGTDVDADGKVVISEPSPVESSVNDPVAAPGVLLLAPDRLATHKSLPLLDSAKAERRLK